MDVLSHVPPGFRFHPTDEELVDFYLRRKIASRRFELDVIKEVDLYKIEPWDLQELCKIGTEEQSDYYFFSHKDKKYPTGTRTNRATTAGFWKATGRDKAIYSKHDLIGMRKTLVFYKGRAPNGQKSDWIMHEYRLETDENGTPQPQEEGWAVCRVFKKKLATNNVRRFSEHDSPYWYDEQTSFMPSLESPNQNSSNNNVNYQNIPYPCKKELDHLVIPYHVTHGHDQNFLPLLESPNKLVQSMINATTSSPSPSSSSIPGVSHLTHSTTLQPSRYARIDDHIQQNRDENYPVFHGHKSNADHEQVMMDGRDQLTDWRVLDKFVASQLSHEDAPKEMNNGYSNDASNTNLVGHWEKQELAPENASTSNSNCQIELWK